MITAFACVSLGWWMARTSWWLSTSCSIVLHAICTQEVGLLEHYSTDWNEQLFFFFRLDIHLQAECPTSEFSYWVSSSVHLLYRWFGGNKSKRGSQAEDFVSAGREFPALHQSRVEPETGKLFYKAGDWLMSREIPGERMSGSRKPQQNRFEKNIINLHSHWIIDCTLRTELRVSTCRQKELPKTNRAAAGQAATEKMEMTLIIMTVVYF